MKRHLLGVSNIPNTKGAVVSAGEQEARIITPFSDNSLSVDLSIGTVLQRVGRTLRDRMNGIDKYSIFKKSQDTIR